MKKLFKLFALVALATFASCSEQETMESAIMDGMASAADSYNYTEHHSIPVDSALASLQEFINDETGPGSRSNSERKVESIVPISTMYQVYST